VDKSEREFGVLGRPGAYTANLDGGKIAHSGYHFIDLIPWILQSAGELDKIESIDVFSTFQKPADIKAYNNLADRGVGNQESWERNGPSFIEGSTDSLNPKLHEINTSIHFNFKDRNGQIITTATLSMFHGGPFSKEKTDNRGWGRVKTEEIFIRQEKQTLRYSRIAKFFMPKGSPENAVGGKDHIEIVVQDAKGPVLTKTEDDPLPGKEFIDTLYSTNDLQGVNDLVRSPLYSHAIGIKLMAAVYKSVFAQDNEGTSKVITVKIFDAEKKGVGKAATKDGAMNSAMLPVDLEEAFKQEDITPALEKLRQLVEGDPKRYATTEMRDFILGRIGKEKQIDHELKERLRQMPADMIMDMDYDPSIIYVRLADIMPILRILQEKGDDKIFSQKLIDEYIDREKARAYQQVLNFLGDDSDSAMLGQSSEQGEDARREQMLQASNKYRFDFVSSLSPKILSGISRLEENMGSRRMTDAVLRRFLNIQGAKILVVTEPGSGDIVGYSFGLPQSLAPETSMGVNQYLQNTFYGMSRQVNPRFQGQGIGSAMRMKLIQKAMAEGFKYYAFHQRDTFSQDNLTSELQNFYGINGDVAYFKGNLPVSEGLKQQYVVFKLPDQAMLQTPGQHITKNKAALARDLGGIDLNQINVNRTGKTINVKLIQTRLMNLCTEVLKGLRRLSLT
jgi:GNAT superfamily N-acetyltransferase